MYMYLLPPHPTPPKKNHAQEVTMPVYWTISSFCHEEVKKTRLEPYSSWATCQCVSSLERGLDPGLNGRAFKGDVGTIRPQGHSSRKMPAQRRVFLNGRQQSGGKECGQSNSFKTQSNPNIYGAPHFFRSFHRCHSS